MNVKAFAEKLGMHICCGGAGMDKEIGGVYAGDLLSWVMSHGEKGDAWITVHTHINIVAVAVLAELACIIIPEGIALEKATQEKAQMEGVAILSTDMDVYEICWKAHRVL